MQHFTESDLSNPSRLAVLLTEHNKWRRGIGKYKWHENPSKNAESPLRPSELTMILNATIDILKRLGKSVKNGVKK